MTLIKELETWKKELEDLNTERSKAEGRLEQAMIDLKSLGFDNVGEARAELTRLVEELRLAEAEAKDLVEKFKVKYADQIESVPE